MSSKSRIGCVTSRRIGGLTALMSSRFGFGPMKLLSDITIDFADRVDRRVGHLGEQLLEIVVQRLVLVGQHGQRRVVAHRADRLFALTGHRRQQELQVFLRVAEGLLPVEQRLAWQLGSGLAFDRIEPDPHRFDPLPVRLGECELMLEFVVVDDAALLEIDQEHLAGLEAPFAHDPALGDRQHARLGGHHHHVVVGDAVTGGAQPVSIQRGADLFAIGEHHGGRAVPWFQHRGVVLVESASARIHQLMLLPGLRNHHHRGVRERVAGHHQQFERVVECGGVRLALEADGVELLEIIPQHGRLHHALTSAHPVEVALDGVDLAVMGHHAIGVCQWPFGKGVGREALVDQRQCRRDTRILQVPVILANLIGEQQAFVDHCPATHARDVVLATVGQLERLDRAGCGLADDVQLAFERIGHDHVGPTPDEDLADDRLLLPHGRRHRHLAVDGHVAPSDQDLPLGLHGAREFLLAGEARGMFLGQKDHADAIFARRRQGDALCRHLGSVVLVGNLDQDSGAVAHQLVGADRAAVVEILQNQESLLDQVVRTLPLDVRDESDAAGVVLVRRTIQAAVEEAVDLALAGNLAVRARRHRALPIHVVLPANLLHRSKVNKRN